MAGEPLFDLELLGYRNDLARERVLALLRGLPEIAAQAPIDRDTPLPHRLPRGLPHAQGLRLLGDAARRRRPRAAGRRRRRSPRRRLRCRRRCPPPRRRPRPREAPAAAVRRWRSSPRSRRCSSRCCRRCRTALRARRSRCRAAAARRRRRRRRRGGIGDPHRLNDEAVELNAAGPFPMPPPTRLRSALASAPGRAGPAPQPAHRVAELGGGRAQRRPSQERRAAARGGAGDRGGRRRAQRPRHRARPPGRLRRSAATCSSAPATLGAARSVRRSSRSPSAYRQLGEREAAVDTFHRARESGAGGPDFDAMVARARARDRRRVGLRRDAQRPLHHRLRRRRAREPAPPPSWSRTGSRTPTSTTAASSTSIPSERIPVVLYAERGLPRRHADAELDGRRLRRPHQAAGRRPRRDRRRTCSSAPCATSTATCWCISSATAAARCG